MTLPVAIVLLGLMALCGFCFWAYLKSNEAQRLDVWAAVVQQLTDEVQKLDGEQVRMADRYGNALQKLGLGYDELAAMSKDIARLDATCAKLEAVNALQTRTGKLELRVFGSSGGPSDDPMAMLKAVLG